jgi:hypothetical protein
MNKRFLKNICFDAVIWSMMYVCLFMQNSIFAKYAENALSFLGVFSGVIGVLIIVFCSGSGDFVQKTIKENYTPRTKFHISYTTFTSIIETFVFASLGWYWVAACWVLGFIATSKLSSDCDKAYKLKVASNE